MRDTFRVVGTVARIAGLCAAGGQSRRSARLFGATEAWKTATGTLAHYGPHPEHDQDVAAARSALGADAFAQALAEGQQMTLDEAADYAFGEEAAE